MALIFRGPRPTPAPVAPAPTDQASEQVTEQVEAPIPDKSAMLDAVKANEQASPDYTIFDAIKELKDGKNGTLMLVNNANGSAYRVMGLYDDGRVALKGPSGATLRPKLTPTEALLYSPVWR